MRCDQLSLKSAAVLTLHSFRSRNSRNEWLCTKLIFMLVVLVLCVFLQVGISYPMADLTTALTEKKPDEFYSGVTKFTLIALAAAPLFAFNSWLSDIVCLVWRKSMTNELLGEYLQGNVFFHLARHPQIDNPGQRVLDDVESFVFSVMSLIQLLVKHIAQLLGFSYVLFSMEYRLLPALVVYAGLGTFFVIAVFGGKLRDLAARILQQNATLRAHVVRVRDNSESIAFFKAEAFEMRTIWVLFLELYKTWRTNFKWMAFLTCFNNAYNYITICIPYIILAQPFFEGRIKFGQISQASLAFSHLLDSLNLIITRLNDLTSLSATTDRLTTLQKAINEYSTSISLKESGSPLGGKSGEENSGLLKSNAESSELLLEMSVRNEFKVSNLTVTVPGTRKMLISDLTYDFSNGSLLIVGPSGVGKSSLFRVLSGLWEPAGGSIIKPPDSNILFLPQVPYMPIIQNNTLLAQIQFPGHELQERLTLADQDKLFGALNLSHLMERNQKCSDWSTELSLGEQQRVGFGRVFTNKPKFAFLDESTSALDENNEKNLYSKLLENNISYISIGHRSSLLKYHSKVLLLQENGIWELISSDEYSERNSKSKR